MINLVEELKKHDLKATPQRIAIYNYLCSTVEHPNADTIYKALNPAYPSMSLATVYKTLDTLKSANPIQELNVGEDSFRYDANTQNHTHAVCVNCQKVYDLNVTIDTNELKNKVDNETEFDFITHKLYCYVICPECKNK